MKPNFEKKAREIFDRYESVSEATIEYELELMWEAGYREAVKTDWWRVQEENLSDPNNDPGRCTR
jgi:hypothetical protein